MTNVTQSILSAALALPEAERLWLVERLMETLPPDLDHAMEETIAAELDRRWEEFQKDPSVAVPWNKALLEE